MPGQVCSSLNVAALLSAGSVKTQLPKSAPASALRAPGRKEFSSGFPGVFGAVRQLLSRGARGARRAPAACTVRRYSQSFGEQYLRL